MLSNCVPLLFFFLGILWAEYINPLCESVVQFIMTWIEAKRTKYSMTIAASQIDIQKLAMPEERPSRQIGFVIDTEEEDYYEEEFEEDDV